MLGQGRGRPVVGRATERAALTERLRALEAGTGGVVVLEGEPGIGKSRLVAGLLEEARASTVRSLAGAGDAIERATPYLAWRPVFARLLGLDGAAGPEVLRSRALDRLRAELRPESGLLRLAPLLNIVVPLDLPDNELTAQMTGQVRADNTHELLLGLLQRAAAGVPLLLVLEDAHWLDSASWALALLVSREVRPALLVLAARPLAALGPGGAPPAEYRHLLATPGAQRLVLDALPPRDSRALICQRLGVARVAERVTSFVQARAGGNPFFVEELVSALRDNGHVVVADGVCTAAPGADLAAVALPDTVQGVVTSRIDQLPPALQLTLKVASVIGREFPHRILHDVFPLPEAREHLADHLATLQRLDLTPLATPGSGVAYTFKHAITQQVAYDLLLFAQRQALHRAVAEWYERNA
ncbi:MAG TPA: AAA family ATPase, partial [Chloroflexota bacterium]|nr:AAA family ATPase [Chloroflexota bacterium]